MDLAEGFRLPVDDIDPLDDDVFMLSGQTGQFRLEAPAGGSPVGAEIEDRDVVLFHEGGLVEGRPANDGVEVGGIAFASEKEKKQAGGFSHGPPIGGSIGTPPSL